MFGQAVQVSNLPGGRKAGQLAGGMGELRQYTSLLYRQYMYMIRRYMSVVCQVGTKLASWLAPLMGEWRRFNLANGSSSARSL